MKRSPAGLLFVLPDPVATARLLPGAEGWSESLGAAGVTLTEAGPDLVVAPAGLAQDVAAIGAPAAILFGAGSARPLRRAGYALRRFLPIPSLEEPSVLVPVDWPGAARYALANLSVPKGLPKRLRNVAVGAAITARAPVPRTVVVASRRDAQPFLVGTGQQLGLPAELEWIPVFGRATERSSFFLFEPRGRRPSWVLKFTPSGGRPERFLDDARGYAVIDEVGGPLAQRTPRLVGVSTSGSHPLTVESAALGAPLVYQLRAPGAVAQKRAVVEAVARWLIDVAASTTVPGGAVEAAAEIEFADGIVDEVGADVPALMEGIAGAPSVLEHRDLDPTHVLVDGGSFTVIDWESVRRRGLPLSDLAFLLSQALPILDGELDDPSLPHGEAFARLFRGESPSAPLFFSLLREACAASDVPLSAAGPLLSLTWLRLAIGARRHLAQVWFADPALGPRWEAWPEAA